MQTYIFPSKSDPSKPPYTATMNDDGYVNCNCPGFYWRQDCTHVKQIKAGTAPREVSETETGDVDFDITTME